MFVRTRNGNRTKIPLKSMSQLMSCKWAEGQLFLLFFFSSIQEVRIFAFGFKNSYRSFI